MAKGFEPNRRCLWRVALPEQKVKVAVFGADEQVAAAIAVEVDRRWAGVVCVEAGLGERAEDFQHCFAVASLHVAQEVGICAIEEEIEPAVLVPIGAVKLAPPAATAELRVKL